jgi:D-arabinose 1-dehydrogenase-like Zn-dependent alcohol dehydrogenase
VPFFLSFFFFSNSINSKNKHFLHDLKGRKIVGGSAVGGMKETQEMIDFAAKHNITADVEVIPMEYINTALERLAKGDVKYRFVIDVANTLNPPV